MLIAANDKWERYGILYYLRTIKSLKLFAREYLFFSFICAKCLIAEFIIWNLQFEFFSLLKHTHLPVLARVGDLKNFLLDFELRVFSSYEK